MKLRQGPLSPQSRGDTELPAQNTLFPVVAVGASAGGLEAFTQLIRGLTGTTGMAFVFVQHLDPSHHSLLAELLSKAAAIPVIEAKSGVA
ncbi:MAG: hypothetical protein JO356_13620, partial [Acidobacteria bacterium]|nr:hypothetical protein [Acidobacteriota bacterium]